MTEAKDEFIRVMKLHARYYDLMNIKEYYMRLSPARPGRSSTNMSTSLKMAEGALEIIREAMKESGYHYVRGPKGEAAFTAPEIDFMIKSAIGTRIHHLHQPAGFLATETFSTSNISARMER